MNEKHVNKYDNLGSWRGGTISLAGVARRKITFSEVRFGLRTNNEESAMSWVETRQREQQGENGCEVLWHMEDREEGSKK